MIPITYAVRVGGTEKGPRATRVRERARCLAGPVLSVFFLLGAGRGVLPKGWGHGLLTVRLSVEKTAPLGDDYVLNAFMAPEGKGWHEATASSLQEIRLDNGKP